MHKPCDAAVVLSVFLWVHLAQGLTAWNVTSSDFWRMLWVSTIVVDNWLYIDGGEFYQPGASSWADTIHCQLLSQSLNVTLLIICTVNETLSIDLSSSWTTSSVAVYSFSKSSGIQNVRDGALWWDSKTSSVISFGGEPYTGIPLYIWALTPDGNGSGTWSEMYGPGGPLWQHYVRPEYGLVAASSTTGYFMGGMVTFWPQDMYYAIEGLVEFSFGNSTWSNSSTVGQYSGSGFGLFGGAQVISSFGKAGVLIIVGGMVPDSPWVISSASLRPMSNVTVYDIASGNWYSQTATGDVPVSRQNFCMTGAQGTNGSTYEIFIYGGWNGDFSATENTDSSNVYILTLPAFRWIRVPGSAPSRAGSRCLVVGNRQMISVGGFDPTSSAEYATADPWIYGIGLFDLTQLSWGSSFNANGAPYTQSSPVTSYNMSNPLYPSSWDDPELGTVFGIDSAIVSTTTSKMTSVPTTSPSHGGSSPHTSIPATIGGVIGGAVGFAAALAGIWWCCLRNRGRRQAQEPASGSENITELGPGLAWEMSAAVRPSEMEVPI